MNLCKTSTSLLESVNTVVIIGATSTSMTLSVTSVGLILVPITARVAFALSLGTKVLNRIILNKDIK